jgi:hypothetical protein
MDDTNSDINPIQDNTSNTPINAVSESINTIDTLPDRVLFRRKSGETIRAISTAENISIGMVQRILDKAVTKTVKELGFTVSPQRIKDMIYAHAPKAVKVLSDSLDSKKEENRLKSAESIIDKTIGKPDVSVNIDNRQIHNWSANPQLIDMIARLQSMMSSVLGEPTTQLSEAKPATLIDTTDSDNIKSVAEGEVKGDVGGTPTPSTSS